MDAMVTDLLLNDLMISVTFSVFLMAFIQKFKSLDFIKEDWQIWIINLIFSFAIGIPFAITFFNLDLYNAIWVGVFGFVGAPSIYEALKQQKIINYTPKSLDDKFTINKENEIKRN